MTPPPPDPPLRVGIVGTGAIAQVAHLPAYLRLPSVRVTALCDVDPTKLRLLQSRHGIPHVHRSLEELLGRDDVDAVDVCLPNHLHQDAVLAALAAGKHVLCEKPLAPTAEGVEAVVEARRGTGLQVLVGMNHRFRSDSILLKRFLEEGGVGEPFYVRAGWLQRRGMLEPTNWRYRRSVAGGGAFTDLGIQLLDLALWLTDYPRLERIAARFVHGTPTIEVEDSAVALLRGETLAVALEASWTFALDADYHRLTVFGNEGSAQLEPLRLLARGPGGVVDRTPAYWRPSRNAYLESYRREIAYFVEVVSGREEPPPLEEQVELMRLVGRIEREAARAGGVPAAGVPAE
ncbi:MAG TPA: Gfo/Idh/MocA family oxidoreductase [Gemmatimonadota bacterium]